VIRVLHGDCRELLPTLPDGSAHTCVTSPPYWGLRDYGTGQWEGGDSECDHVAGQARRDVLPEYLERRAAEYGTGQGDGSKVTPMQFRGKCGKCGATRIDRQLGLESTPEEYVARMVEVFREVRRVLRDDGTLWLNLGDSYATGSNDPKSFRRDRAEINITHKGTAAGLKPKDLCGIPWLVAFALRADGWYLRSDIIWHKPNPMPESVTDRPTKSHEYLFLMSKSERYYYDAAAIAEEAIWSDDRRAGEGRLTYGGKRQGDPGTGGEAFVKISETRNRRTVWTVTTQPYSGAHFATFPPKLIEPCILAGCPNDGTVLDPFFGAGTTGVVCQQQHVRCIGIELNPDYCEIARKRLAQGVLFGTGGGL
jgi:DNA modification methylase